MDTPIPRMMDDRPGLATGLLQEAVYSSRARQAAGAGLAGRSPADAFTLGSCGLGDRPGAELDLSKRGEELLASLWPGGLDPAGLRAVADVLRGWIELQDALDRRRNHFLRDFRQAHGLDRDTYGPEEAEDFAKGLEDVNLEVDARRREAALRLIEIASGA